MTYKRKSRAKWSRTAFKAWCRNGYYIEIEGFDIEIEGFSNLVVHKAILFDGTQSVKEDWDVSETTTGLHVPSSGLSKTRQEAIDKACIELNKVGRDKFYKVVKEGQHE